MSTKKDKMPSSYANSAFEEEPTGTKHSGGQSPVGSNIFIVKQNGEERNRSHTDPYHEPVTQKNLGRTIFRGIRCKFYYFILFF
jgi:hypothetical protein